MTVFDKGLLTVLACEVLFSLLSVPLILRKVPPNPVYGYRTPTTLRQPALWYEANAYFGWRFLTASLVAGIAFALLHGTVPMSPEAFLPASVVALGLPVLVAGVLTSRFVRSLAR